MNPEINLLSVFLQIASPSAFSSVKLNRFAPTYARFDVRLRRHRELNGINHNVFDFVYFFGRNRLWNVKQNLIMDRRGKRPAFTQAQFVQLNHDNFRLNRSRPLDDCVRALPLGAQALPPIRTFNISQPALSSSEHFDVTVLTGKFDITVDPRLNLRVLAIERF